MPNLLGPGSSVAESDPELNVVPLSLLVILPWMDCLPSGKRSK